MKPSTMQSTFVIRRIQVALIAVMLAILVVGGKPNGVALAAVFIVTETADTADGSCDADCSLREAINSANAAPGPDTIEFDAGLSGQTIGLTLGELQITDDLTIDGLGVDELTIDGNGVDIFRIDGFGDAVVLTGLTIEDGEDGIQIGRGDMSNGYDNIVTVTDIKITQQRSDDGLEINGHGNTVTVDNCNLEGNEDNLAVEGNNNTVTVTSSTIKDGTEDGIEIDGSDNNVTVENSTVYNNGLEIAGNDGFDVDGVGNVVELRQVTFSSNSNSGVEIEGANSDVTVVNSTISGNGNGIAVKNTTSEVTVKNTIIARNIGSDCLGVGDLTTLGNNIIGDSTGCDITLQPTDLTGDPGLGEFTDDGTPGNGHFPLLSTSQAIDAGNNDACPSTDQIGRPRVDGDGDGTIICDIGAIEFSPGFWPGWLWLVFLMLVLVLVLGYSRFRRMKG